MEVSGQFYAPSALPPDPLGRRLGGLQSRSACYGVEKNLSQESQPFFFSESNSIPPEYEARLLGTHPSRLVIIYLNCLTTDVVF